ncbi:MAG TPA: hypothetical protein VI758_05060 [Bacteroidota bacterium]
MKKSIFGITLLAACVLMINGAYAQASANQTVNLSVNTVYKIATSGNPGALTVTTGTAGTDALTSVSDASTTYSITQNFGPTVKITANLDAVLQSGYTLQLNLASSKGTSAGTVDISNTSTGSGVSVVTGIGMGADAGKSITYTFSALASAGTLTSTTKTVTLTLTN